MEADFKNDRFLLIAAAIIGTIIFLRFPTEGPGVSKIEDLVGLVAEDDDRHSVLEVMKEGLGGEDEIQQFNILTNLKGRRLIREKGKLFKVRGKVSQQGNRFWILVHQYEEILPSEPIGEDVTEVSLGHRTAERGVDLVSPNPHFSGGHATLVAWPGWVGAPGTFHHDPGASVPGGRSLVPVARDAYVHSESRMYFPQPGPGMRKFISRFCASPTSVVTVNGSHNTI